DVVSFIQNPFNALPTKMQTFGVDVIDGFVGGSKAIWEGAKGFFTGIVDFIKNPFGILTPEMQVIGGDIINNLLGGAQSLWEGAKTFFSDVAGFIQDPFGTIGETFSGYGENIMDGIVGGVSSKLSAAKETITNVGNSIKGWFTSVLGIHSPSRVFMGYGENITEGAAIGIEQGLPDAKKAIDKLSDEMQLTPSLLSSKSGSGSFDVSYSKPQQDSGNTITITFSPTINANDVTGVKEALKLSQSELEKMINEILRKRERRSYA
ncbi:MAG: phage tail protein, partial [Wohlfahrtiimonas sp.]